MNRRDTIIIAVLINTGLLAVLFMMAINTENRKTIVQPEIIAMQSPETTSSQPPASASERIERREGARLQDEIDEVLRHYHPVNHTSFTNTETQQEIYKEPVMAHSSTQKSPSEEYVQVKVKRGDFLEKIARANGTTTEAIMTLNHMSNERIEVGQVLLVPVAKKNQETARPRPGATVASSTEPQYYTLKSGDNPWKIAKQFHVRFDELLSLNNLDEAKARNLKPGDVLRVR